MFKNKARLHEDRGGFAITFEVAMTMLLFALVVFSTIFISQCYQIQRYFAEVTSSTCTLASRYGGNSSNAYKIQMQLSGSSAQSIQENANAQLKYLVSKGDKIKDQSNFITVSDYPDANNNITVNLSYSYNQIGVNIGGGSGNLLTILMPNGGTVNQTITLPSIMQNGKLLRTS